MMDRKRLWHFTILAIAAIFAAMAEQSAPNDSIARISGVVFAFASLALVMNFAGDFRQVFIAQVQKRANRRRQHQQWEAQRFPSLTAPPAPFFWDD
jgi:protein-S-isoprenylcysteine O-methyltransferase Ste14